ncbi:MAG: adenosylcobinamide-GDP ribazoletransferase, partial [Burkholderiales bacterium]|nr:adenosylcobinamide-GDP ribazoletransferase [Burkholderiales bacterium]
MQQLRLFFTALEYFTRWPKPRWVGHDPAWLGPCMRWFPALGALVGLLGAAVLGLAAQAWPPWVAAALSTAATLLATGALHEDGFADVCDGLGGSRERERALAIMGDSRIGAFGAIGIAMMLLLKIGCLAALQPAQAIAALVCAHVVSRAGALVLMRALPYAKPQADSKARPLALGVGRAELAIGIASALLVVAAVAAACTRAGPPFGAAP